MKKTVLLIAILILNKPLFAQLAVGLAIGDNLCKISKTVEYYSYPYFAEPRTEEINLTSGLTIGIPIEFNLTDRFSLNAIIAYIQKGYKSSYLEITLLNFESETDATDKFNYLELPLLSKFYLSKNKLSVYLTIGPSLGYILSEKNQYSRTIYDPFQDTVSYYNHKAKMRLMDFKGSGINRFDISLSFGFGIDYKIGTGKLFFNVNYFHGLTDMVKDTPERKVVCPPHIAGSLAFRPPNT